MHKQIEYTELLRDECYLLCLYLIDHRPPDYIVDKYIDAHKCSNMNHLNRSSKFDGLLIKLAKKHPILMKLTDIYTSFFRRSSTFRKKIILMLALLESNAPSHYYLDPIGEYHREKFLMKLISQIHFFIFSLMLSTIVFWPLHVISVLKEKPDE